jgi:hypothetical protein
MLNRVGYEVNLTCLGNYEYTARKVLTLAKEVSDTRDDLDWYIYASELSWNRSGFLSTLTLRK